jgi:hypothetical protein
MAVIFASGPQPAPSPENDRRLAEPGCESGGQDLPRRIHLGPNWLAKVLWIGSVERRSSVARSVVYGEVAGGIECCPHRLD